jgi:hypothetical protein
MEITYRGHRLEIAHLTPVLDLFVIKAFNFEGTIRKTHEFGGIADIDEAFRIALGDALFKIDNYCDNRLAYPEDENQPGY